VIGVISNVYVLYMLQGYYRLCRDVAGIDIAFNGGACGTYD